MKTKFFTSAYLCAFFLTFGAVASAFAQDDADDSHQIIVEIPTVALIDIEPAGNKNITASFTQAIPLEAGEKITAPANNNTLWLNYSSIQTGAKTKRVDVSADELVPGVDIHVVAAAAADAGAGTKGTQTGGFNLTTGPQILINGIGSAYTLSGSGNGHQLTYSFSADDTNYGTLRSGPKTVVVTYTLAEN